MKPLTPSALALVLTFSFPVALAAQGVTIQGVVVGASPAEALVVYLVPADSNDVPRSEARGLIDQVGLRFVPTVLAVRSGGTVEFRNSDPILHNVFSPGTNGAGFDLGTYPENESRSHTFTGPGTYAILCNVHPEMYAYVVVVPTPFHDVVDSGGGFRIEDITPGTYTVSVWRRRQAGFEAQLTLRGPNPVTLSIDLSSGELEVRDRDC